MKITPASTPKTESKIIEAIGKKIPTPVKNWVSNPRTAEFVENTFFAVSVETAMKAIGRPIFIMADKEADSEEKKKYAATKELLYQALCLTLYLGALPTIKKYLYQGISGIMSKKDADSAEKIKAFNDEKHLVETAKEAYKETGSYIKRLLKKDNVIKAAKTKWQEAERTFHQNIHDKANLKLGKGVYELSAIIGSILMLTVVAPQISHLIIHPIMKALGKEHPEGKGGH